MKVKEKPVQMLGNFAVTGILAMVSGLICALAAILFVESISLMNDLLLISADSRSGMTDRQDILVGATLLVPMLGGVLVGLLVRYLTVNGRPHMPPEVIKSVMGGTPFPGFRSVLASTVGAAAALGFGASVGQFGPLVVFGAAIGRAVSSLRIKARTPLPTVMTCGVAAAIAAAFGAPLTGLVFAHELVLRKYSIKAIIPTAIASGTGYLAGDALLDRPPLIRVLPVNVILAQEMLALVLIGGVAGLVAIIYMRLIIACGELSSRFSVPLWTKTGLAGLAVGLAALWLPDVLGEGITVLKFAEIEAAFGPGQLAMLIAAKIVLTAICLGFGFPGGTVGPALLVGMLLGILGWKVFGTIGLIGTASLAPYAIGAMTAVVGSSIGVPVAAVLLVFEVTGNPLLTMAGAVSVAVSCLVSRQLFAQSVFDEQIRRSGVDLARLTERASLSEIPLRDCEFPGVPLCSGDQTIAEFLDQHPGYRWSRIAVVDGEGGFLGMTSADVRDRELASGCAALPDHWLAEASTLADAVDLLESFEGELVPVLGEDGHTLDSVIDREALATSCSEAADIHRAGAYHTLFARRRS